jgi:DNA-binding MarR family transcriptional regulator
VLVHLTEAGRQVADQVSTALRSLDDRVQTRAGEADAASFLRIIQLLEEELTP